MINNDHESTRQALVTMLRNCADSLSGLAPSEVDAFLGGELELRISVVPKKRKPAKKRLEKLDVGQLSDVARRLRSMDNRAEGERLLRETVHTKSEMEMLARHLDIAVRREDRLEDLLRRIIETTIGYRLSSAAIQGRTVIRNRNDATELGAPETKK